MTIPYTEEQSERAFKEWKATCGHHCIATVCQTALDAVRLACPKLTGWMNPTMVSETLMRMKQEHEFLHKSLHGLLPWEIIGDQSPQILRIQFEGPWLNQGVPVGAAYQRTHYITTAELKVMDPMINPTHVMDADWWLSIVDKMVKECIPKSTGWHFTHAWRIRN